MTTEYDNSKHNTSTKINSRSRLVELINQIAFDCNKYWTLCNKIVGTTNEFTQITSGTHFKPNQFFGADYEQSNIDHNKALELGANFFAGDLRTAYFPNTDKDDECVVNLDTTNFSENAAEYAINFMNLFQNNDYKPPLILVNCVLDHRGNTRSKKHFTNSVMSHKCRSEGWSIIDRFTYDNGNSIMQYNICIPPRE